MARRSRTFVLVGVGLVVAGGFGVAGTLSARPLDPPAPVPRERALRDADPILQAAQEAGWRLERRLTTRFDTGHAPSPSSVPLIAREGDCVAIVAAAWGDLAIAQTEVGSHFDPFPGGCPHGQVDAAVNLGALPPNVLERRGFDLHAPPPHHPYVPRHADRAVVCFDAPTGSREHRMADVRVGYLGSNRDEGEGGVTLTLLQARRTELRGLGLPRPPPIEAALLVPGPWTRSIWAGLLRAGIAGAAYVGLLMLVLVPIGLIARRRAAAQPAEATLRAVEIELPAALAAKLEDAWREASASTPSDAEALRRFRDDLLAVSEVAGLRLSRWRGDAREARARLEARREALDASAPRVGYRAGASARIAILVLHGCELLPLEGPLDATGLAQALSTLAPLDDDELLPHAVRFVSAAEPPLPRVDARARPARECPRCGELVPTGDAHACAPEAAASHEPG